MKGRRLEPMRAFHDHDIYIYISKNIISLHKFEEFNTILPVITMGVSYLIFFFLCLVIVSTNLYHFMLAFQLVQRSLGEKPNE